MPESEEQRLKRLFSKYHENRLLKNIEKIQEGKNDEVTKLRFFSLIREEQDEADSNLHDCIEKEETKSNCYSDYGRSISKLNDIIDNIKDYGKMKSFLLPCLSESLDDETLSIIKEINTKISERTAYGIREELAEENSLIIRWSNSSKSWTPSGKAKKGEIVNLDTNMILIKDLKDKTKLGHATSCLKNLPLYGISSEAIHERKETPVIEGILTWVERQIQMKEDIEKRKKQA